MLISYIAEFAWNRFSRYKEGQLKQTTEYQMKKRLEKIVAHFDGKNVEDITTDDVRDFMTDERRSNWSKATFASHRGTMKELFAYAIEKERLAPNAINRKRIKNPGVEKNTRKSASVKEYEDILKHIPDLKNPVEQLAVAILAYSGMRPEELFGLRWEDVDLSNNRINIQRAVTFPGNKAVPVVSTTKTKNSKNWIPIVTALRPLLEKYREETGWVIHDGKGNLFKNLGASQKFRKGIKNQINLYNLRPSEFRNTVASVLTAKGVDIKSTQRLFRHANADITANTYANEDTDTFIAGCNKLCVATA